MEVQHRAIQIEIEAPFYTLGEASEKTEELWMVCHGYGQLAYRFIRRFDVLDPAKHLVIAPQGLSKFYLENRKGVGATWMTRENRLVEIDNYLKMMDQVFDTACKDLDTEKLKINVLGFSQGVATATRWAVHRKLPLHRLILWAGTIAAELKKEDFDFLSDETQRLAVIGLEDEFITADNWESLMKSTSQIVGEAELITFEGKHEIKREVLSQIVQTEPVV